MAVSHLARIADPNTIAWTTCQADRDRLTLLYSKLINPNYSTFSCELAATI